MSSTRGFLFRPLLLSFSPQCFASFFRPLLLSFSFQALKKTVQNIIKNCNNLKVRIIEATCAKPKTKETKAFIKSKIQGKEPQTKVVPTTTRRGS